MNGLINVDPGHIPEDGGFVIPQQDLVAEHAVPEFSGNSGNLLVHSFRLAQTGLSLLPAGPQ